VVIKRRICCWGREKDQTERERRVGNHAPLGKVALPKEVRSKRDGEEERGKKSSSPGKKKAKLNKRRVIKNKKRGENPKSLEKI